MNKSKQHADQQQPEKKLCLMISGICTKITAKLYSIV